MIKFFHNPQSRGVMVHWLLEELGVEYEIVPVDFEDGSMRTPEFLAVNPMGKIPALLDGDIPVSETGAIAIYLADKYKSKADLAPALDDPNRAEYLKWLVFQSSSVDPAMMQAAMKTETNRRQAGWGNVETVCEVVETRLQTAEPYLFGQQITAADIILGAALYWAMKFDLFPRTPALEAYLDHLSQRPAFKTAFGQS